MKLSCFIQVFFLKVYYMTEVDSQKKYKESSYQEILILYLNECFEAFIAILIIRIAVDKTIDIFRLIQASMLIGLLTFLLENYNKDLKSNIKQGITFTAGSQIVNTFV